MVDKPLRIARCLMETFALTATADSSASLLFDFRYLDTHDDEHHTPERPIIPTIRFVLCNKSDANCLKDFRFDKAGILQLIELFALPEYVITAHRDKLHRTEALCILLYWTSYPRRNYDVMTRFGRSEAAFSRVCSHLVTLLYERFSALIFFQEAVCKKNIRQYARAVREKGAPMHNVFGFIDGTKNAICRPSPRPGCIENLQNQVYSGHKRMHCLNYQAVVVPDGLAIHFWGPIEGKRHDITLLRECKLVEFLASNADDFDGFVLYGDPAYGVQRFIVSGFKKAQLTENEKAFNAAMSSVRETVEWMFALLKTLWAIDYKKKLKLRQSPIGKLVLVCMLLTNCHTCYNGGNEISKFFQLKPPTLAEYLNLDG